MTDPAVRVRPSRLRGRVQLSGAKNSVLKLQVASLLTHEPLVLDNVPSHILDFQTQNDMLSFMGKTITLEGTRLRIAESGELTTKLDWDRESVRSTLLMLGALLARKGRGRVPLPGGCRLGDRKFDLHVMVMEALGARVWEEDDGRMLCAEAPGRLVGAEVELPLRSTGATENALLMASLAHGRTRIWNPHVRPEILDLIDLLQRMGAGIEVRGQESILVDGVEGLTGADHRVIPDNMEALTLLVAGAITEGEVEIVDFPFEHLEVPLIHLTSSGLKYFRSNQGSDLVVHKSEIYPFDVATGPYPGINSDMQPILAVYGLMARGVSHIADLRFLGRFQYTSELEKLGARIEVRDTTLIIRGGETLRGAEVRATDLRGGAAVLLCGLIAEGETVITNFRQVLRGYDRIVDKLISLGADIDVLD